MSAKSLDQIVSLCKQRGFIFPGSEIYGGLANTWDYGPIGVELKNNVKKMWWDFWVTNRDDVVGIDAAILMNPRVWEASGHVSNFSDPLVDCKSCKKRFRGDKLIEEYLFNELGASITIQKFHKTVLKQTEDKVDEKLKEFVFSVKSAKSTAEVLKETEDLNKFIFSFLNGSKIPCPACKKSNWSEPRNFNLMFRTSQGVTEDSEREIYMRPETAQGIFVNFKNVLNSSRKKLPFGIAQIGKAFRNEITPGNFTFRTREFEQMEVEYFCAEKDWEKIYPELEKASWDFFEKLGIDTKNLRWRKHEDAELSHYSKLTKDIEYKFPWGWGELQGLAYRANYDLKQHAKFSGESLEYLDNESGEKFVPHCIEPSFGCDRTVLTVLLDAYSEDEVNGEKRVVMKFDPKIAPIKVAVLPLSKKENLTKKAREIYDILRAEFRAEYDETQSIGKRYRRQDEIGTPLCVTVDFGTIGESDEQSKKDCVTVRDRDSLEQVEVPIEKLVEFVRGKISN